MAGKDLARLGTRAAKALRARVISVSQAFSLQCAAIEGIPAWQERKVSMYYIRCIRLAFQIALR